MYVSSFIELLPDAEEPVSLPDAKAFCAIDADYTGDDALLESLIRSARQSLEKYLNLGLIPQKRTLETDLVKFDLPYYPIIDIESVKDSSGEDVAYSRVGSGKLILNSTAAVTITYSCGLTAIADDLQTALKLWVRGLYDKEPELIDQAKDLAYSHSRNLWL